MRSGHSGVLGRRNVVALAVAVLGVALWTTPVLAAGNAALDAHIISDPIPGGVSAPASYLNAYVAHLQSVEDAIAQGVPGVTTAVAAEGWQVRGSSTKQIQISLIALRQTNLNASALNRQASAGSNAGPISACDAATGSEPFLDKPIAGIPSSHFAVCDAVKGLVPEIVGIARDNVIILIETDTKTFTKAQIDAIALRQYDALGTSEFSTSSGSKSGLVVGLIVGGVALIIIVVVMVLVVRRSTRRQRQHAPPPGLYMNVSQPQIQLYWTGATWTQPLMPTAPPGFDAAPQLPPSPPAPGQPPFPPPPTAPGEPPPPPPWPPPTASSEPPAHGLAPLEHAEDAAPEPTSD
jgi:hypothetical protein